MTANTATEIRDRRSEIISAALDVAKETGFERLNLRALGARLGCSPMMLYHYFASKDELLAAMADHALGEISLPTDASDWIEWYIEATARSWAVMTSYPGLASYVLSHGPVLDTPASVAVTRRMLEVLLDAGFAAHMAAILWRTCHSYLSGYAPLPLQRAPRKHSATTSGSSRVNAVLRLIVTGAAENGFEAGLREILHGFARHLALNGPGPSR